MITDACFACSSTRAFRSPLSQLLGNYRLASIKRTRKIITMEIMYLELRTLWFTILRNTLEMPWKRRNCGRHAPETFEIIFVTQTRFQSALATPSMEFFVLYSWTLRVRWALDTNKLDTRLFRVSENYQLTSTSFCRCRIKFCSRSTSTF